MQSAAAAIIAFKLSLDNVVVMIIAGIRGTFGSFDCTGSAGGELLDDDAARASASVGSAIADVFAKTLIFFFVFFFLAAADGIFTFTCAA